MSFRVYRTQTIPPPFDALELSFPSSVPFFPLLSNYTIESLLSWRGGATFVCLVTSLLIGSRREKEREGELPELSRRGAIITERG